MEVLLPNFWFNVWKIRKNQNKSDEKGKTKEKNNDENLVLFSEILEKEMEKYKA